MDDVQKVQASDASREATQQQRTDMVSHATSAFVGFGVTLMILGCLALALPRLATLTVGALIGFLLLAGGVAQILHAWSARPWRHAPLGLIGGGLSALIGLYFLASPDMGAGVLSLVLGVLFLVGGASKIGVAMASKHLASWGWILFNGVVTMLLGILILSRWPGDSAYVIGLLVGIELLFSGWALLMLGTAAKKAAG